MKRLPLSIIEEQVIAYNNRDISHFASLHHPSVELYNFGENTPYLRGRDKVHEYYGIVFNDSPLLHTEIVNRIILGNKVLDHEVVTGRQGIEKLEIVAIYEIIDELIKKVTFIRK